MEGLSFICNTIRITYTLLLSCSVHSGILRLQIAFLAMESKGLPNHIQVGQILKSLCEEAYWIVSTAGTIDLHDENMGGYELMKAIEPLFYNEISRNAHKVTFDTLKQEDDSLEIWKYRVIKYGRLAYPGLHLNELQAHEPVVMRFIDGLTNPSVRLETRRYTPKTLDKAFEVASIEWGVQVREQAARENRRTRDGLNRLETDKKRPRGGYRGRGGRRWRSRDGNKNRALTAPPNTAGIASVDASEITCYNCEEKGNIEKLCILVHTCFH